MNLDPRKFFIGLMDFFTILLPGMLLTYLLMDKVGPVVLGERYSKLADSEALAAFLIGSYLLGHLTFLLGSWLDVFYEWAREHTLNNQIKLMARCGHLLPWPARVMIWLVFKRERNQAIDRVIRIKEQALSSLHAKNTINAFQWCKVMLNIDSPDSLAVVQRFEADSKFFRSFTVMLLILLIVWPWQHEWPDASILVVSGLFPLAMWRYMDQRFKATNQAYWSLITYTAWAGKMVLDKPALPIGSPACVASIVYRMHGKVAEYLLIETKDDPNLFVLPEQLVEEAEHPRETAIREVHEKTGIWAHVIHDLGDVSYAMKETICTVRCYLMKPMGHGLRKEKHRQYHWLPLDQALEKTRHIEAERIKTSELLQTAEQWLCKQRNDSIHS